jgi:hypothetical protein
VKLFKEDITKIDFDKVSSKSGEVVNHRLNKLIKIQEGSEEDLEQVGTVQTVKTETFKPFVNNDGQ